MTEFVQTQVNGYVATVTIDRPPLNAMTQQALIEVRDAFNAINDQTIVRVAILTGAGRAFSAGIDMKEEFSSRDPNNLVAVLQTVEAAADAIQNCRVPVIGAINGVALAGGFVMASACDILLLSDKAQLGVPEVSVGIVGGTERLRRLVPEQKARMLAITGGNITAQELFQLGSVEKVVGAEELLEEAGKLAEMIASRSPLAVEAVKQSQNVLETNPGKIDAARLHWMLSRDLFATEDSAEAVDAFFGNRSPDFKRE
ncbi:enoyl-CoA hydratase-related protein [Dehalococcoidia bacterium]|nr:enoyl-CoA hydratase-related protein [Dehalococcoidia bacterium]